jgi:hypothetical protein
MQLELVSQSGEAIGPKKKVRRPPWKLYEPREVKAAMEFIATLVSERLGDRDNDESRLGLNESFEHDKDLIAQAIGSARYGDLPPDARSFVSKCAALKKTFPRKAFMTIAQEQERLIIHQSEMLWNTIVAIATPVEARLLEEKEARERRRTLIMRMSCLFQ